MTSDVKFSHMPYFLIYAPVQKLFLRKKRTFAIKQILIFLEAVLRFSPKYVPLKTCNFIKKKLQHRCFPVRFGKYLRTPSFSQNISDGCFCLSHTKMKMGKYIHINTVYSQAGASDSILFSAVADLRAYSFTK